MKILIIARGIPSEEEPQWGCFEFDQAKALRELGHEVTVMAVDRRWKWNPRKLGIHINKKDGIQTIEASFTPHLFIAQINLRLRRYYAKLTFEYLLKRWGVPDIIYSHYLTNTVSIYPSARKYNLPIVGLEHWSKLVGKSVSKDIRLMGEKTYGQKGLTLLTVSQSLKNSIKKKFGIDSIVVPNMLGEEFMRTWACEKSGIFTFVSIGALIPRKGFDILIEAASKIKSNNQEWRILIIGEGSEKVKIEKQIINLGLKDRVYLLGKKTKEEICQILSQSHAFVLPSRSETFGVVYIEAMAMGLPVVATSCGIPDDLISPESGIVCPIDDSKAITEAMIYIMENPKNYDTKKIRDICLEKYSPKTIALRIESILKEAIARNE